MDSTGAWLCYSTRGQCWVVVEASDEGAQFASTRSLVQRGKGRQLTDECTQGSLLSVGVLYALRRSLWSGEARRVTEKRESSSSQREREREGRRAESERSNEILLSLYSTRTDSHATVSESRVDVETRAPLACITPLY